MPGAVEQIALMLATSKPGRDALATGRIDGSELVRQAALLLVRALVAGALLGPDSAMDCDEVFAAMRERFPRSAIFICVEMEAAASVAGIREIVRPFLAQRDGIAQAAMLWERMIGLRLRLALDPPRLSLAAGSGQKRLGSYYTPPQLADLLLEEALDPVPGVIRVCDPACGSGALLQVAARRLIGRGLDPLQVAQECIFGSDLDPIAADLCRFALTALCGGGYETLLAHVRVGNALTCPDPPRSYDVVLSNPPWEVMQAQRLEFMRYDDGDSSRQVDSGWHERYQRHRDRITDEVAVIRRTGRLACITRGKINQAYLFVELAESLLRHGGRACCIVPSGLLTDQGAVPLFQHLLQNHSLARVYHFDNRKRLFPAVGSTVTFCTVTLAPDERKTATLPATFFLHDVTERTPEREVQISPDVLARVNPETGACPIVRSPEDLALLDAVHRHLPVLAGEDGPWRLRFRQGLFNMTFDAPLFSSTPPGSPLYEAKMFHHFTHSLRPPRYWVDAAETERRLATWDRDWLLALRLVCRSTDERTVIGTILPRSACGNSVLLLFPNLDEPSLHVALLAILSSVPLDWCARQKQGGANLNFHVLRQLPVPAPETLTAAAPDGTPWHRWLAIRALALCAAPALQPLADACKIAPWQLDAGRRSTARAEIDAACFYLYSMGADQIAPVCNAFPIARKKQGEAMRTAIEAAYARLFR